jgi:hypothetical protein
VEQLTDALRHLDPPAPPSSVDLDAVVRRAHRHRLRSRVFLAGAAATVLAALVAVPLTQARHRDGAAQPPAACVPSGRDWPAASTEAEHNAGRHAAVAAGRLTPALDPPLRQALPGATLLDAVNCEPGFSFRPDGAGFVARVVVVDGTGVAHFQAWVSREPAPDGPGCGDPVTACIRETRADGTVVHRLRADRGSGAVLLAVEVYRPDGVHVRLAVDNFQAVPGVGVTVTRPGVPLDETALDALTQAEHLTL